jgi:hypothetical protein
VTDSERAALANIAGYASVWRIRYTSHALERMDQRGASRQDVQAALSGASRCRAQPAGRWKVTGADRDGDELVVIVVLEDGVVVVTVF